MQQHQLNQFEDQILPVGLSRSTDKEKRDSKCPLVVSRISGASTIFPKSMIFYLNWTKYFP